jgi:hypothetical protein
LRLAKRAWALARQLAPGYGWAVAELWGIDAMAVMYVPLSR